MSAIGVVEFIEEAKSGLCPMRCIRPIGYFLVGAGDAVEVLGITRALGMSLTVVTGIY